MELLAQNLGEWHQWVNSGALAAFAVFVCFLGYRVTMYGGKKALELGERYIVSTETLHETLRASEEDRTKLCSRHADGLATMASAMEISNKHLAQLVTLHTQPGGNVHDAVCEIAEVKRDVAIGKRVMLHACDLCQRVAEREFPGSAADVTAHCEQIRKAIGEA